MTGQTSSSIKWGIIGTGDVAEHKSGPAFYLCDRSELVAVTNRTLDKARDFARRHRSPVVYETATELLSSPDVNAVYIGTPPDSHLQLARLAAESGKHVLVEKPMALTLADCKEMCRVCEDNKVSLVVAFYRRYFPVIQKAKSLLNENRIGKPLSISVKTIAPFHLDDDAWRLDPNISGGGFMMDMGTHRFDLFTYLFGPPRTILGRSKAQSWSQPVDDAASIAVEFENGGLGNAVFHWNSAVNRDELEIIGTNGSISIHDLSGAATLTLEHENKGGQLTKDQFQFAAPSPVHLPLIEGVVAHLLDGEYNPCSGIEAAWATKYANDAALIP